MRILEVARPWYSHGISQLRRPIHTIPRLSLQKTNIWTVTTSAAAYRAPKTFVISCLSHLHITQNNFHISRTSFSSSLTIPEYHQLADTWLFAMYDAFEDAIDQHKDGSNFDISLSDGVLTLRLGDHGTYVINKQTPNKQIWLSSPTTGPKRYDWNSDRKTWVYSHDNVALDTRLEDELGTIFGQNVGIQRYLPD
eukprot:gene9630-1851_t